MLAVAARTFLALKTGRPGSFKAATVCVSLYSAARSITEIQFYSPSKKRSCCPNLDPAIRGLLNQKVISFARFSTSERAAKAALSVTPMLVKRLLGLGVVSDEAVIAATCKSITVCRGVFVVYPAGVARIL